MSAKVTRSPEQPLQLATRQFNFCQLNFCRSGILGLVLLAATLLSACGATDTATSDAAVPADTASTQPDTAGQNAVFGTEEFGLSKQQLVEHIETVEGLIAKCMTDNGFEYVAVDYDTVRRGMTSDKALPGVSDEDFITQYGYGYSTLYTGLSPQFSTLDTAAKIGLGQQNVEIFNRLSDADKAAYSRALLGQNTDATFAVALEGEDFTRTGGCTRTAVEQIFTEDQLKATYFNPLDARIEQDPRMLAAMTEFSDCVRKEGFNFNHPDEAEKDIKSRLDIITAGIPIDSLSPDAKAALEELQGEERAIATVVTTCAEDIIEPMKTQLEREFSK